MNGHLRLFLVGLYFFVAFFMFSLFYSTGDEWWSVYQTHKATEVQFKSIDDVQIGEVSLIKTMIMAGVSWCMALLWHKISLKNK